MNFMVRSPDLNYLNFMGLNCKTKSNPNFLNGRAKKRVESEYDIHFCLRSANQIGNDFCTKNYNFLQKNHQF